MAKAKEGYRRERLDRGIKARCDTTFMLTSYREILYMVLPRLLPVAALVFIPLALGISGQVYWQKVFILACVISLLALSWDYLASVGLVSLGHALFFGVGGYIAGALNYYLNWPIFLTIPVATLGGALICTGLLAPVMRLRGIYFSMVTLALPLMLSRIFEATKICRGTEGLPGLTPFPNIWVATYLVIAALLVCLFGFRRLIDTDYGLVLRGIRDNDRGVMASGTNIYWAKIQAIFISAAVGAFAGAFMTHNYQFVGMSAFALDMSILSVASAVLGGVGTFAGPTLGAFILVPVSEVLRGFGTLRMAIYCLVMVGCIVGLPEGIFHYIERKYHQFERWVPVET
jgi:branched-chain amino acid transport system permease protein